MKKMLSFTIGLVLLFSGCNLTSPYVVKDNTPNCESVSCAQHLLRLSVANHSSRESTSTDPTITSQYQYVYNANFFDAIDSDFGELDLILTDDLFDSPASAMKVVRISAPRFQGEDCSGSTALGLFTGSVTLIDLNTNQNYTGIQSIDGFQFANLPGHAYRIHYEFSHLNVSMRSCRELTLGVIMSMNTQ